MDDDDHAFLGKSPKGPYARGKAPSLEPAWVGHHPSWVAKSGPWPKPNRPRLQTRGDHP